MKNVGKSVTILFILLISSISTIFFVNAQSDSDAIIVVLSSVGGNTDPFPGTYNYANGTVITLTATPNEGFEFLYWVASGEFTPGQTAGSINDLIIEGEPIIIPPFSISGTDYITFTTNPAQVICGYGYTFQYQAIFAPIVIGLEPPQEVEFFDPLDSFGNFVRFEDTTFVIVSSTEGGTTTPDSGRYLLSDQVEPDVTLTAFPDEGFEFQHWVVSGSTGDPLLDSTIITENPLNIICGRGYTYAYDAVFTQVETDGNGDGNGDDGPEPEHPFFGLSSEIILALILILIIALIIAVVFGIYAYNRNK